ncbi:MAG: hypothetical protein KGN02_06840 [bacterium]|nr:hypothetical protein [bacterium]
MRSSFRLSALVCALALVAAAAPNAERSYVVHGDDAYRIGAELPTTHITYDGTQRLEIERHGATKRFVATATYTRVDDSGKASVHARFVQAMLRDGSFEDRADEDPDFLTILNQPFAIELDATTMRDLRALHGALPFEATSPLGGARLHGFLRPAPAGIVNGVAVVGIRFQATGPMTGTLPQRPDAHLDGTIRMDGTAYYAIEGALLLALDATLTIQGQLASEGAAVPVRIVYHRTIRASGGRDVR